MKKTMITKRDIVIFVIGLITMLLAILIYEWEDFKTGFRNGYDQAVQDDKK
jgi:hypothetical protein